MKPLTFFIFLIISSYSFSQEKKKLNIEKSVFNLVEEITLKDQMLDSIFYKGRVLFKSGNHTEAYLNYNLLTNGIFFLDDNKNAFQLIDLPSISMISYGKRSFIPINQKEVAEVVEIFENQAILLLNRRIEVKNDSENRGAYGGSTSTSSVTNINTWNDLGIYIPVDRSINVEITIKTRYLLKNNNKVIPIHRLRDLKKLYPDKWDQLKEFVETNNLKFNVKEDVVSIIRFSNE